ncbi:MAG: amidase [Gammaproteobacteria bacterium]|jgi:amidase|nr:amidase [Gammaproteobacteria bacterium]
MRMAEYAELDANALADALREGTVTQSEVIQAARSVCAALNPSLNAVLEFYADAQEAVAEAGERNLARSGPLAGVPILRKDVGATEAGRLQECGSRSLVGHRAARDSAYVQLCRRAGLIFVGRSATPEFAISSATESVLNGVTRNPWNLERMAGGSSGGAAAAVAAGIVPIAHASDGGGSIRIPAAACGLVGLKPSRGRVSQGPEGADALLGLGTEFVITRSIRDAAAALDILSQPQPGDPFLLWSPGRSYAQLAATPPARLRIAVTAGRWGEEAVNGEIAIAVASAARLCEELGHQVVWASPRFDFEAALRVLTNCFAFGLAGLGGVRAASGAAPQPALLEPVTFANWELSRRLTAADIDADLSMANSLRRDVGAFFAGYDVLVTPALANPPPPHGLYSQSRTDLDPLNFMRQCQHTDQFLPIFNITGQPALSIPIGISSLGLPIGLQLVGRSAHEHVVLALGQQLMEAAPVRARPAVWAGAH